MTKRSNSYCCTLTSFDSPVIDGLRTAARVANRIVSREVHRGHLHSYVEYWTVRVKGRLGKNNPAASIYREKRKRAGTHVYLSISNEHATRWDVYLQLEKRWFTPRIVGMRYRLCTLPATVV